MSWNYEKLFCKKAQLLRGVLNEGGQVRFVSPPSTYKEWRRVMGYSAQTEIKLNTMIKNRILPAKSWLEICTTDVSNCCKVIF